MEVEEILKGLELSGGIVITGNSRRVTNFLATLNEAIKILKKINADGCVGCKHEDVPLHCTPCDKCRRNCPDFWESEE
nr:MAG TPA: 4Fe-4S double cluster binding domain protein [Caudoviricetes sp.]